MKVSLNTVKQYINFELPSVDELVKRINEQLGGVEDVVDLGRKYADAVVVKVVSAEQHPNADRLRVCLVDDGGVTPDVPRNDSGFVQVVCGAPNARAGIFAVWLPPQSTVPASFDDEEPFVLSSRELRGVLSHGMLAAGDELAINGDHDGIIEIDPAEPRPIGLAIEPGVSFAKAYGLDDTIIDIENKMFTHRPDCFGQLGVAREIAGIFGQAFTSPAWYLDKPEFGSGEGLSLEVFNKAPEKVARFMAVTMKDIEIKPSPLWLQCELVRLGSKAINNVVDLTNYIMLLSAQPVHAYDYDKLRGQKLGARLAQKGETATLLNGKTYELSDEDIVIVDGEGIVGLGGIMGGGNSEVSAETKNVVLEVATFDMYAVRKTSMRHGVFTDALTRFNKGQSPLQNDRVLGLLMTALQDIAGGKQAGEVFDVKRADSATDMGFPMGGPEALEVEFINSRLGLDLDAGQVVKLLTNVEIEAYEKPGTSEPTLFYWAPFWRMDIELAEDVVEEVGRLYGFDKLPRELPMRSAKPVAKNLSRELKQSIRDSLARGGANEVLTYSFVHENIIKKAEQRPEEAFRLGNALSPDLQYYRLSLTPSLLDKVYGNIRAGYDEFGLFEIGKAHNKQADLNDEGLPVEFERTAFVYAAKVAQLGAPYYRAKHTLEYLMNTLGVEVEYRPLAAENALTAPFEPKRSAEVYCVSTGEKLGVVGEYKTAVARAFKLPYAAGFELMTDVLQAAVMQTQPGYKPLSRFPGTERDVCFQVEESVPYGRIIEATMSALRESELETAIEPVDIYQSEGEATKNVTIRIKMTAHDRTLTSEETSAVIDAVVSQVVDRTAARVI